MRKSYGWKAPAAALLAMLASCSVAGVSGSMCRYVASANVTASARVAKWAHAYNGTFYADNAIARTLNGAIGNDNVKLSTSSIPCGTITNNSEVTVDYRLYIYAYNTDDVAKREVVGPDQWGTGATDADITGLGTVSCTGGVSQGNNTWRVAPGGAAVFSVTFPYSNQNRTYRCRAYIRAVQVD